MSKRFWSMVVILAVLMLTSISVVNAQVGTELVTPPPGWVNAICLSSEAQPLFSLERGRYSNARLRLLPNTSFFVPEVHTAGQYVVIRYESRGLVLNGAFVDAFRCQLQEGAPSTGGGGASIANFQYLQDDVTPEAEPITLDGGLVTDAPTGVTVVRETMPEWAVWLLGGVFLLTTVAVYYALYVVQKSQWHISNSVPASSLTEFLKQTGHAAGTAGLELIAKQFERTPVEWDNEFFDALKPRLKEWLDDYFGEAPAVTAPVALEEVG